MTIFFDPNQTTDKGSFKAVFTNGALYLPLELYRRGGINPRSIEEFLSYVHSFPTTFMVSLNWTLEDFNNAKEELIQSLTGIVSDLWLHPEPPPVRAYGALPVSPEYHNSVVASVIAYAPGEDENYDPALPHLVKDLDLVWLFGQDVGLLGPQMASGLIRLTGNKDKAYQWLRSYNPALDGHTPLELLERGSAEPLANYMQDLLDCRCH